MSATTAKFPWFEAIDSRSWNDLPRFFHPEVVYERPGYPPIQGLAALLEFYSKVRIIAEGKHSLEGGLRDEGKAICWGHFSGRSKDGATLAERFADAYELEDGLIRKRTTFFFRAAI
ncbi:MAG TPA: nuclear transport factor 2 family protein [Frateuria sp.]|uniref:nuclear transport factor 2 family protein n=1 Tax=Frateuria sp. TaxID=2211372 RepID=UPI002D7EE502|nr:nuclear transport factor 2 family protein [Frateuria sp.]HET6805635.1 nuclear transport factor 2 family protein [Frateuria sp.]